jgi:hypothetical protein
MEAKWVSIPSFRKKYNEVRPKMGQLLAPPLAARRAALKVDKVDLNVIFGRT